MTPCLTVRHNAASDRIRGAMIAPAIEKGRGMREA